MGSYTQIRLGLEKGFDVFPSPREVDRFLYKDSFDWMKKEITVSVPSRGR